MYVSNYNQEAGFFVGAFGVPRAYDLADDGQYRNVSLPKQTINHFKIISNTHIHLPIGKIELDAGVQWNQRKEIAAPHAHGTAALPTTNTALQLDLTTFTGNIRYAVETDSWKNIIGISGVYQQNNRSGYEFLIPNYESQQLGIFDFIEHIWNEKLLSNAGIRLDYAHQSIEGSIINTYTTNGQLLNSDERNKAINRNYFNIAASAGLQYRYHSNFQLKSNIGTAYRMPAVVELAANGVHHGTFRHEMGNAALQSEKGLMLDIGGHYEKGKLRIDFTPFINYFFNYLYLSPSGRFSPLPEAGQIYMYSEAPAIFAGFESNIDYKLTQSIAIQNAIEYVWNANLNTDLGLPFTPPLSWLHEVEVKPFRYSNWFNQMYATVSGHLFAAQNRTDRNEPTTDGYYLINLGIGNTFNFGKQRLQLMFQARNLLNTVYMNNMSRYRILNLPEQGRNIQCLLRFEF